MLFMDLYFPQPERRQSEGKAYNEVEKKKLKDKRENDSPLLADERWQRSVETPGSSV